MVGPQTEALQRGPLIIRAARKLWRLAFDPAYRNVLLLNRHRPKGAFQPFNDTASNRYPRIFSFVQSQLGRDSDVTILSFGCSTGEEVFSLRRYFPRAFIKGIDVNRANIAICRRRLRREGDARLAFEAGRSLRSEAPGSFDAIFCMAVLRHGGLRGQTRCDHLLRFEDFAVTVDELRDCLKAGGLLIIRHSNFRLCDTPAAADFETILRVPVAGQGSTPLFGPDDLLMPGAEYPDTVFRKLAPHRE
jgi:SAM-dependent methyltransferase